MVATRFEVAGFNSLQKVSDTMGGPESASGALGLSSFAQPQVSAPSVNPVLGVSAPKMEV